MNLYTLYSEHIHYTLYIIHCTWYNNQGKINTSTPYSEYDILFGLAFNTTSDERVGVGGWNEGWISLEELVMGSRNWLWRRGISDGV